MVPLLPPPPDAVPDAVASPIVIVSGAPIHRARLSNGAAGGARSAVESSSAAVGTTRHCTDCTTRVAVEAGLWTDGERAGGW